MKVTNYEIIRTILVTRTKNRMNETKHEKECRKNQNLKNEIDVYGILLNRTDGTQTLRALNNGFPCSMFTFPNFMDSTDYYYYMCMHWWQCSYSSELMPHACTCGTSRTKQTHKKKNWINY